MKLLLLTTSLFCLLTAPSANKTPNECTPEIARQLRLQESFPSYEVAFGSSFEFRLPVEEVFDIPEVCTQELVLTLKQKEEPYDFLRLDEGSYVIRGEAVTLRNFHFTVAARIKDTQAISRPGIIRVRKSTKLPAEKELPRWIAYPVLFAMFTTCALLYYYASHYMERLTLYAAPSAELSPRDLEEGDEFGRPYAHINSGILHRRH